MSTPPSSPVWFITGCSSGFGLSLATLALKAGHKVIATSRNPSSTPDLVSQVEKLGGKWLKLDVISPDATSVLGQAIALYGKIDILVNNAGYALLGAFETLTDAECRAQLETNFFGPIALCRHIVPSMRARRSGIIINMSSAAGIQAKASRTMYSASKFALEAFSEALYAEMKSFNVRVLLVEPGWFRSKFSDKISTPSVELPKDYEGTIVQKMMDWAAEPGVAPGDVEKGVQAIFDVAMKTGQAEGMEDFLRLSLGKDGSESWKVKLDELHRTLDATKHIWSKTDHDD